MKKTYLVAIVGLILGFLIGIVFVAITLSVSAGHMVLKEFKSPYDFDKTVEVLQEKINAQPGWRVTDIIDQNQSTVAGGGQPIAKMKLVKYCSGKYSAIMLNNDDRRKLGAMMPKSFAVYQKTNGQVYVSTMNGAVMAKLFGGETEDIMEKVSLDVEAMLIFMSTKFELF